MHLKISPLIALLVALTLILVSSNSLGPKCSFAWADNSDSTLDEAREPQHRTNYFGLLAVDSYYNETKHKDRLKLSKGYLKMVTRPLGTNRRITAKATVAEELVRCENLTLAHAEMETLVDCKTLEAQLAAEGLPGPSKQAASAIESRVSYVKRATIRLRHKPFVTVLRTYPLQSEFTKKSMDAVLLANGMKSAGYGELATSQGNYFELSVHGGVLCSGNLFTMANQSEPAPSGPAGDGYPELFDLINHHAWEMLFHGGILSLQDVSCEKPNQLIPFSLDFDLTLIRRLEFPFWSLRHTMTTQPMSSLWQYEGAIKQWRHPGSREDAYNTTVKVLSESSIFEYLQFAIDQTFVNTDSRTGAEQMLLNHPFAHAMAKANWTADTFLKTFALYFTDPTPQAKLLPSIQFDYKDDAKSDHVDLRIKLSRPVLQSLSDLFYEGLGVALIRNMQYDDQEEPSTTRRKPHQPHTEL